jgi:hypothetical protein
MTRKLACVCVTEEQELTVAIGALLAWDLNIGTDKHVLALCNKVKTFRKQWIEMSAAV